MKMRRLPAVLAALPIACAGTARADLTVIKADGTPATPAEATRTLDPVTGEWTVTLNALYDPGGWTLYEIHGNGGEILADVVIDVPCWEVPDGGDCMPAGSPVVVRVLSDPPGGIRRVRSVRQTGTAETLVNRVEAEEDIGSVVAEAIGELFAGRDVIGPVTATTGDNPNRGITRVEAQRDILGDVTAEHGAIGSLLSWGKTGTAARPVRIHAKHGIDHVLGLWGLWADVNTRVNGGAGTLHRLWAPWFGGALETESLVNERFVGTPGRIRIFFTFDGRLTIGKSLEDPAEFIELPPAGLTGQVIVNADAEPGGVWLARVFLGPEDDPDRVVLASPTYTETAAALGGGAVGLVPFALHRTSCDPPPGTDVPFQPSEPLTVDLVHYGPIQAAGAAPVLIERRLDVGFGPFTAAPPEDFVVSIRPDAPRTIRIAAAPGRPGFASGFEYRISATAALRCAVPAAPPVAWAEPYRVTVFGTGTPPCPTDLDGSGAVGLVDLLMMLAAWGACPDCPEDVDGDGVVGVIDLVDLLFAWGPCE
jgi:hypothetical protein